jgi:hypothetical protein
LRESEKELRIKSESLGELNSALKVLLQRVAEDHFQENLIQYRGAGFALFRQAKEDIPDGLPGVPPGSRPNKSGKSLPPFSII